MKIKSYTWILAGAYLLSGAIIFCIMRRFLSTSPISEEEIRHLPVLPAAVYAVGPLDWLLVMLLSGTFVFLKDFIFPSRSLNRVFTAILVVLVTGIIFTVMSNWYALVSNSSSIGAGMEGGQ